MKTTARIDDHHQAHMTQKSRVGDHMILNFVYTKM
jgi:hypothetical protein